MSCTIDVHAGPALVNRLPLVEAELFDLDADDVIRLHRLADFGELFPIVFVGPLFDLLRARRCRSC